MARYSISYQRLGEKPAIYELEAKSDAEARMRFLNLSWVAFQPIAINSIAIKGAQPEEAKVAVRTVSPIPRKQAAAIRAASEKIDWQGEVARLTEEIGTLADQAQALTRAGDHDAADALRAKAKKLSDERAAITKRNKRK